MTLVTREGGSGREGALLTPTTEVAIRRVATTGVLAEANRGSDPLRTRVDWLIPLLAVPARLTLPAAINEAGAVPRESRPTRTDWWPRA